MDDPFPRNHNTVVPSSATRSRERNIFYRQKMRGQPGRWTVLFPCNHNTYGGAFFSYRLAREKTFSLSTTEAPVGRSYCIFCRQKVLLSRGVGWPMDDPSPRNHNTVVPSSATRSRERNIFYRQKMRGQPGRWTVLFPCNHNTYGGAFFSYRLAREKTFSTRRKCGDRWVKQLLEKILGVVNFIMLFLRQTTSPAVFFCG